MTNPVAQIRRVTEGNITYDAIMFWCPGCEFESDDGEIVGGLHMLPINSPSKTPSWAFEGTLESPTLSPSILTKNDHSILRGGKFICHSFLRQGVFEFLGDCTHQYANQKVPMKPLPDWVVRDVN